MIASLHSLRIRVLASHDEEAPHGCGFHAVNLLRQDEPYPMETATILAHSEYPGHEVSRLSRSKVVQTLADYSNAQLMPLDRMERQCELGLKWLKTGEIEGMIFLGSGVPDKNLRSVEWTRQWMRR